MNQWARGFFHRSINLSYAKPQPKYRNVSIPVAVICYLVLTLVRRVAKRMPDELSNSLAPCVSPFFPYSHAELTRGEENEIRETVRRECNPSGGGERHVFSRIPAAHSLYVYQPKKGTKVDEERERERELIDK